MNTFLFNYSLSLSPFYSYEYMCIISLRCSFLGIWIHLAVVIPMIITNLVFKEAEKNGAKWYREWSKHKPHNNDGV